MVVALWIAVGLVGLSLIASAHSYAKALTPGQFIVWLVAQAYFIAVCALAALRLG